MDTFIFFPSLFFQWIIISVDCHFFASSKLPYTITEVNEEALQLTLNKAILHEILDTSLNSFRFMLYIGVKEWICIHKNCCHDESNDPREDKLICLLTEMEFHTF